MKKKIKDLTKKEINKLKLECGSKECWDEKCPFSYGYYCALSLYQDKETRHLVENEEFKV